MLSTQMMKLANNSQWKVNLDEQTVFGEFNGYLFTGLEGKDFKAFITPLAGIKPGALKTLLDFLDHNAKVLRLRNYEVTDNFLCIRIKDGFISASAEKMEYLLAQISGLLDQGDLAGDACVICGQTAERKGLYYGFYCYLHPACQDREPIDFTTPAQDTDDAAQASDDVADA